VVEDEDRVRELAVGILRYKGHKVLVASKGGDAFFICEQHKNQLI
jgi:CheY-like chemotaxis protein